MKNADLAPILLFVYKRLDTLKLTVPALQQNYLASESVLFIFSDAAKKPEDQQEINEVRKFIKTISGFKRIQIVEAEKNKGLANSVIDGVTRVLSEFGKAIVLEDDLLTSANLLSFLNQGLEHYKGNEQVFSISGYSIPVTYNLTGDVYFTKRSSSWGWATWKERWQDIDWKVEDYKYFEDDPAQQKAFNRMGSDLSSMLKKQMEGNINSWAIRWVYHQFKQDSYSIYPIVSKVKNIGFGEGATHTFDYFNRYDTELDKSGKRFFSFTEPHIDHPVINKFVSQYSLLTRAKYKILNTLAFAFKKLSKQ